MQRFVGSSSLLIIWDYKRRFQSFTKIIQQNVVLPLRPLACNYSYIFYLEKILCTRVFSELDTVLKMRFVSYIGIYKRIYSSI